MSESIVASPTYFEHIRHFFDEVDIEHMRGIGIDLSTYEALKERAPSVYFRTKPPNATMPPDAARHWTVERSETFANWIRNGFPLGEPTPQPPDPQLTDRVRKDAAALSSDEIALLRTAFSGAMARPPDDLQSYFHLAGIHWFPAPNDCLHHEDRYNPWHRAYMTQFEDALRSVPGCESVTVPYWNITAPPPDFLSEPPFESYTLPEAIHADYPAGYATSRYDPATIASKVVHARIPWIIENAMQQSEWTNFVSYTSFGIEAAHDEGHGACGGTMVATDAAAFDPLFWFFHANWDRLWWQWQQKMGATTLATFRSTITGSAEFLEAPFNELPPFTSTSDQTIDLHAAGVSYTYPAATPKAVELGFVRARLGSLPILEAPRVHDDPQVSVRLKGINRLAIPGSFFAVLHADGEEIGCRTFFQSTTPVDCANCRERAQINLDFMVDVDQVLGKTLSATIELAQPTLEFGSTVPLGVCGDPSLNVRLLVQRG